MAGQALFNQFISNFLQIFLTDAGVTALAVGAIFLFTRVFDAANDPVFGGIIDRAHFKGGKFLPWLRAANILIPVFILLIFFMPRSMSGGAKAAWAAAAYVCYSIAYTICDVPIFSMVSAITDSVYERIQIQSTNSLFSTITTMLVIIAVPLIYPAIGWVPAALAISIFAAALMIPMWHTAKERFVNKDTEAVTLKNMFHYIKSNKYLLLYFTGLLILMATNTTQAAGMYFAVNNLGNPGMMSVLSVCLIIPMLLFVIVLPHLAKRFDKFKIFLFCVYGQIVISLIGFFAGYENMVVFIALMILRGVFWGGNGMMMLMFTADFIEYGEFKTGKRLQATVYSIQTFVCKLFTALAGAICMFALAAAGFVEGVGAVQNEAVLKVIWMLVSLLPAAGAALSLPFFLSYKLCDKDVQLMAKANTGEINRELAEQQFSRKYVSIEE
jgi:probable glucitol transport protein GutA